MRGYLLLLTEPVSDKFGYTKGCGGCSSWYRGLGRQPHTEACRDRFRELLKDEARVISAQERKRDSEEMEVAKKRKKGEKRENRKLDGDQFQFATANIPAPRQTVAPGQTASSFLM